MCGKEEPLKVALGPSLVNLNQFISWFIVANFYNILISSSEVIENLFWRKGVTVTVECLETEQKSHPKQNQ